jgi:hypothetical protein
MQFSRSHVPLALVLASTMALACADAPSGPPNLMQPTDVASADRGKKAKSAITGQIDQTIGTNVIAAVVQITHLSRADDGSLLADGVISGTANGLDFEQAFTDLPVGVTSGAAMASAAMVDGATPMAHQSGGCGVLFLDLGPLHLDLLGLVVDLAPVVLDISAVPGPGNLLGNLLCALTGLLDLPGAIAQIINIIDRINAILGSF